MTSPASPLDWRRVNEVFHQALTRAADARETFVREACGDAPEVCAEVLSLLEVHGRSASFLEQPAARSADVLDALAAQPTARDLLTGDRIGHYRVDRLIGEGGMGVVYLAEDLRLGRTVALKVLPPAFAADAARRERLRREARAAAALTHPGVATVYAFEEVDDCVFITSEYVPGDTLRQELQRGPLSAEQVLDTAISIVHALAAAHDRGIVHRDVKPENLIRTSSGEMKILDFGLAHLREPSEAEDRLTRDGAFLGTPAYMSPEQIRHEPVDGRSDLFALGAVLYELMAGTHPFAGASTASTIAKILESDPARVTGAIAAPGAGALAGGLEAIVRTCLAKSPAARFATAHHLLEALERVRAGTPASVGATPATTGPVWWWQFHQVATSAAYGVLLAPLWPARAAIGGRMGLTIVLSGVIGAVAAAALRLHLWFTLRSYASEWARQRDRNGRWIRLADIVFVTALAAAGLLVVDAEPERAAILIGAGVLVLVSFAIIEPATTRAARL